MTKSTDSQNELAIDASALRIFNEQRLKAFARTDRLFAVLMALQWAGAVAAACILSPRTWHGAQSETHPHVWFAVFGGGLLALLPIALACRFPGRLLTRHLIAVNQILFSSLFIHISGGRIETHFHVFGSLAFLAFYLDWPVLVLPTVIVALDHFVRGVYWPETVFGIASGSTWRWLEHAAWVLFEDVFLVISCCQGAREMRSHARRTAEIEAKNDELRERTTELEHAYEATNAIVETALDAVISMDIDGRITGWNSYSEKIFGWTAEEVLGKPLNETIIPLALRGRHLDGLKKYRDTGSSTVLNRRLEMQAIDRTGREFPIELSIAPIRTAAGISFSAFVRDIAARQQAADALRSAKEAAEAANRAKSVFLANMSHEIRTPLNAVLGFADILMKTEGEATAAERRDYLETIMQGGRHLLRIINDVLDLSKVEAGQMEVEPIRCAPHEIMAGVISILRVRAQEKGIELENRWTSRVPETVVTDPSRLRQLLMNLVGNAIKFTERGCVEVVARVDETGSEPHLVIDIIDTGIGIAPEFLDRIFQPFTQADQSITRRFGGTGLGLAISRQIAAQLGGDVTVSSAVGRGSTFTLTISIGSLAGVPMLEVPAADLMPAKPPTANSPRIKLPPMSILLVDDGPTNRKLVSLMLRRAGAEVMEAENGRIAVDLSLRHQFDLILMDMQMPVLDGYMATAELRRLGLTLPIIALTAHSMKGDEERCRTAGCSGYITKPIDTDRLLHAVSEAFRAGAGVNLGAPTDHADEPIASTLPTDDDAFRQIVEEFIERLEGSLVEMRQAQKESDWTLLAEKSHWLKGSGGTAGFSALTEPAAALERAANDSDTAGADQALNTIAAIAGRLVVQSAIAGSRS